MMLDDDCPDFDREEAAAEARWQRRRRNMPCQCGTDMPGTCPGPMNCPNSGHEDDSDE